MKIFYIPRHSKISAWSKLYLPIKKLKHLYNKNIQPRQNNSLKLNKYGNKSIYKTINNK